MVGSARKRRPLGDVGRRAAGVSGLLALLALSGCPGRTGADASHPDGPGAGDGQPGDAAGCEATLPDERPSFAEPPPSTLPVSSVGARLEVALERLRRHLHEGLPVDLAKGQTQRSGGRISYSVRRSGLDLALGSDELLIRVPVAGQASVCVPVGPICPNVGGCSPALQVTAHVPLELGPDLRLRTRSVDIEMTRGCVIAGVDASSQIRSGASGYSDKIRGRLDELLPSIRPEVEAAWARLSVPAATGEGRCVRFVPEQVSARPIASAPDALSYAIAITGSLTPPAQCAAAPPAGPSAMPGATPAVDPTVGTSLAAAVKLEWAWLSQELTRTLDPRATVLEVRGTRAVDGTPRIALRVGLRSPECGELWLEARPAFEEARRALRLRDVVVAAGQPARASRVKALGLEAWVQEQASAAIGSATLPASMVHARTSLEHAAALRTKEAKLTVAPAQPAAPLLFVVKDGVVVYERANIEVRARID